MIPKCCVTGKTKNEKKYDGTVSYGKISIKYQNQILTSEDMFIYCKENLSNKIKFFHTINEEIEASARKLIQRLSKSLQIPGTRKYHKFVPINEMKINAFEISLDEKVLKQNTQKTENAKNSLHPVVLPHNGVFLLSVNTKS